MVSCADNCHFCGTSILGKRLEDDNRFRKCFGDGDGRLLCASCGGVFTILGPVYRRIFFDPLSNAIYVFDVGGKCGGVNLLIEKIKIGTLTTKMMYSAVKSGSRPVVISSRAAQSRARVINMRVTNKTFFICDDAWIF